MKEYSYGIAPYRISDGKIYLLLNKTSSVSDWNFFKGKIEDGETIEECAVREFLEETGCDLSSLYKEKFFFQKNKRKDIGIFLIQVFDLDIQISDEIFSFDWIELKDDLVFSKNQIKIYNDIFLYFSGLRIYFNKTTTTSG
jgi:8-oxo-dGTP pyrophosphatase MutT (NUDIX family)